MQCVNHPGRPSVVDKFGQKYCTECNRGMIAARGRVTTHVEPKECFIWYLGHDKWEAITGTGCAHWAAHQLNIRRGRPGDRCLAGYTYRVPVLVEGKQRIHDISKVQVNDIYVAPGMTHNGIVIRVTAPNSAATSPTILIRHDSSALNRVAESDFATYFHSQGAFYR